MGLGLGGKCGMFFLVTINTLFLLLGLGLMIIGIVMRVNSDHLHKDQVLSLLNKVSFNGSLSLGNVANSLSILVISLGVFIMIVAALGAFGACCKNRCLLVTYAIIVLLVFVVQCVAVGLWFTMKDKVEKEVQGELTKLLADYEGGASTKETSVGWDLVFLGFECCGVDAVATLSNSAEFADTVWGTTTRTDPLLLVPGSCCQAATEDNYQTYTEDACQKDLNTHYKKGCYEAFKDWLGQYQTAAIVVGIVLIVVEVIAIIFAFVVCRAIGKKDMMV